MKNATIGAILLLLLGAIAIGGWYYAAPMLFERQVLETSDAPADARTLHIGGDNYLGYWFVTSPEMRKQAGRHGLQIQLTDDGGAYAERLAKFAAREYDAIVLPINSYLLHGRAHQFPGVIVAAIAESRGADGIVAFGDRLASGKINDLNDANLKIVYTGQSPSEFLLDLTIADFDLDQLRDHRDWRVEVGGSSEVHQRAVKNQGDVFVLWEPDLSKTLRLPGMKYVWGSDKFSGYIVDVFVFHRTLLQNDRAMVADFLETYFRVLSQYANARERLAQEMATSTKQQANEIEAMLGKIDWFDLDENCRLQFGIKSAMVPNPTEGVVNTILAATDVMLRTGRLDKDPINGNPYLLTNSSVLEELSKRRVTAAVGGAGRRIAFATLDDPGWARLPEVGTFRVEPITFQSWNNLLTAEGKQTVDRIAQLLQNNYPEYRVIVRGHTTPGGDETENEKLSLERADAVAQYLKAVHSIDPNRLRSEGAGSKSPSQRKPKESSREYQYRLSRVEFVALGAGSL